MPAHQRYQAVWLDLLVGSCSWFRRTLQGTRLTLVRQPTPAGTLRQGFGYTHWGSSYREFAGTESDRAKSPAGSVHHSVTASPASASSRSTPSRRNLVLISVRISSFAENWTSRSTS